MRVDGELGGAVGVGRPGGRVLPDRHRLGLAVGGRGGGEDDPPAVGGPHGLEQRQRTGDVGVPVVLGLLLGRADEALGREVQHRLGPDVGQHGRRVVQRDLRQRRARGHGVRVAGGQVVEHGHLVALGQEGGRDYAADVTGSAGDEYAHGATLEGRPGGGRDVVVSRAPASRCRRCPAYKPGRNPADLAREIGVDRAVKLASNEVAFPPLPAVLRPSPRPRRRRTATRTTAPSSSPRALADRYGVEPGQVATGCGAVTVCQQLAQAFNDPGSSIAFAWRSFEMYPLLAQVAGARAIQVPLAPGRPGGPADTHDLEALAAAIDETTRLVFVCNPNNPTGTAVRRDRLERFLDAVPGETLVVLDEAYREFVTDPDVPDGAGADARAAERRRPAHVLQGVGAGRSPGRLPDGRGPGRGRGRAQDPGALQRLACSRRRRPWPPWPARTRCAAAVPPSSPSGTGSPRRCASADWRSRTARPTSSGCRSGSGRATWPLPSRPARSSPARSPARAYGSRSAPPTRTTSSWRPWTTCARAVPGSTERGSPGDDAGRRLV